VISRLRADGRLARVFRVLRLVACTVARRRREITARMPVGATPRDVQRLILQQAARLTLAGCALGLAVGAAARPLLSGIVQGASAGPPVWAATTCALVAVVTVAD
jgi:putative ABC transport system permease protein